MPSSIASTSVPSLAETFRPPLHRESKFVDQSDDISVPEDGRNLSGEEQVDLWKKNGMCIRCGLVRTHARPRGDTTSEMQPLDPITVDGEVYKGYHLSCFGGLDIVMDFLGESTQTRGPNARTHHMDLPSLESSVRRLSAPPAFLEDSDAETDIAVCRPQQPKWSDHDHEGPNYDKLTVFQAAPLVWKETCADEDGNCEFHPIEMLDFEREREVLETSLRDAKEHGLAEIDLVFETATTDRLGAFLATSNAQVLHFTCHGAPEYLCMEDGSGGAHFLMVDELRELMSASSQTLEFVFVSACYSRAAGEAFVKAGVPHVVCCQQDEPIMDMATIEFSRNFYLALACGKNVQEAFNLARQCVMASPSVPDAANEMRKFLLLPEGADHNVQVFFKIRRHRSNQSISDPLPSSTWILPPPPQVFVGRELEMYKIIRNLRPSRLIRLRGEAGSGKSSLAAAVAHYVSSRGRCLSIDEIIWLPLIHAGRVDSINSSFQELFAILEDDGLAVNLHFNMDYRRVVGGIIEHLHQTKALLVIETKTFLEVNEIDKLSIFLQDLFRGTRYVRVILMCQDGLEVALDKSWGESEVVVEPLDFKTTATLFGRLCRYVSERRYAKVCTPRQLANLLVPKDKGGVKINTHRSLLSKRCIDIFSYLGEGNPAKIHKAAMTMKPKEYDALIAIAERLEYCADCKSRVELELQLSKLNEDLAAAVREKNFTRAKEIQVAFDELERLRETLPQLGELRSTAETLNQDLDRAVSSKDFAMAEALSEQLDGVNAAIKVEEEALLEHDTKPSAEGDNEGLSSKLRHSTRAGLEMEIRQKREELEESIQMRDFASCRIIQTAIDDLESRRESLPCHSELSLKISSLSSDLDAAVIVKDFVAAESIHRDIQRLKEQVKLEEESEDNFVSVTAISVGKQLVSLGEKLDKAVQVHDKPQAKELEGKIREEIMQLEIKFTLDYGFQTKHDDETGDSAGGAADDEGAGDATHDRALESRETRPTSVARGRKSDDDALAKQKKRTAHAPRSGSRQDVSLLKEASTEPLTAPETNADAAASNTLPGAVAVPGPNSQQRRRRILAASELEQSDDRLLSFETVDQSGTGSEEAEESETGSERAESQIVRERLRSETESERAERLRFEARWARAQRRLRGTRLNEGCFGSSQSDNSLPQEQRAVRSQSQIQTGIVESSQRRPRVGRSQSDSSRNSLLLPRANVHDLDGEFSDRPSDPPTSDIHAAEDGHSRSSAVTFQNAPVPTASPVDAVTQQESIERIVRDIIGRDAVEAEGIVAEEDVIPIVTDRTFSWEHLKPLRKFVRRLKGKKRQAKVGAASTGLAWENKRQDRR